MRVFVTGATGVLGRRVIPMLTAAGHEVTAVARSDAKARGLEESGARPVAVDLFEQAAVRGVVAGHDAVLHLATSIPPSTRMVLPGAWKENDRLRRQASRNLVSAALEAGASRYVQESIAFLYADGGRRWLGEDSPLDVPEMFSSALAAEEQAQRMTASGGVGVALRFGQFVAPDSTHMVDIASMVRRGVLPLFGDPDGYESFVHAEDAAAAVVAALEVPAGVYNAVEDEPLTRRQHADTMGELLDRRVHLPPAPLGRLPLLELRARSLRVSNAALREASHWSPSHPSMRTAWRELLDATA